jgi:hypothetical protein
MAGIISLKLQFLAERTGVNPRPFERGELPSHHARRQWDAQPIAKDVTNAYRYPYACETTDNPAMSSHETHGDSREKAKCNRKTKEGQKEKSCNNDDQ